MGIIHHAVAVLAVSLSCACTVQAPGATGSTGSGGAGGGSDTSAATGGAQCPAKPIVAAVPMSGCDMHATTPECAVADLTGGKAFELSWTTNHTFCEGSHHVLVGGDPPSSWKSAGNYFTIDVASQDGAGHLPDSRSGMTRNIGGYLNITAADLQGIQSPSGIYYYVVADWFGAATSEVIAFRVTK